MGNIARILSSLQTILLLVVVAVGAYVLYRAWDWLKLRGDGSALLGTGIALKESPLGLPSRAIDKGVTAATGREETLGTWLGGWLSGGDKRVEEMLKTPTFPHQQTTPPYVWTDTDTELRRILH